MFGLVGFGKYHHKGCANIIILVKGAKLIHIFML